MYVSEVVASSESLITFDVFVLDAGDTSYVWCGVTSRCPTLQTGSFGCFSELRREKSSTSAASEIVQLPRSSEAAHSWIPYRSGDWL